MRHCPHCLTGCKEATGTAQCHPIRHLSAYGDMWPDGGCDICALIAEAVEAERKRIVAWLRGAAIYDAADFIARGAHLEEK